MIDLLTQKFTFAMITPFKDYCQLSDENRLIKHFDEKSHLLEEIDDDLFSIKNLSFSLKKDVKSKIFTLPIKNKKKVNYLTTNKKETERILFDYLFTDNKGNHVFETTNDRHIKNHYGRPFSEIIVLTLERSVRLHDDKLTIKLYVQTKTRGFNCIYFRKKYEVQSVTINLKTGNFVITNITKTGKTNSKNFKTNSFRLLKSLITGRSFFEPKNYVPTNSRVYGEFFKIFDDVKFTGVIKNVLGIQTPHLNYSVNTDLFLLDFVDRFVTFKKIKIPNGDYVFWLTNFYPTEKYLKKNDRKLVASVLDMLGIKSKYTIKILHEYPNIDLMGLVKFCNYFGKDYTKYLSNLDSRTLANSYIKKTNDINFDNNKFNLTNNKNFYLKDVEKENLIKIANSQNYRSSGVLSQTFTQLLDDHFRMIETIRDYDPDLFMKAKTPNEFHLEHTELSKIISAIKKGWVVEYKFNDRMVEDIQKPIPLKINLGTELEPNFCDDLDISFYPMVLKREEEYIEEGKFMHHCVATYADKEKSIIISVRTKDGSDRVTCEYDCQNGTLLQARHFCNKQPPVDIEHVIINDLSPKVKKYARLGLLHSSEKLKVPIKINGIEIEKKEPTRFGDIYNQDGLYHF